MTLSMQPTTSQEAYGPSSVDVGLYESEFRIAML
jgi:hypothetical protein